MLILIIISFCGCGSKKDSSVNEIYKSTYRPVDTPTNAPTLSPLNIPNGLSISPNDRSSFLVNNQLVKVEEATSTISTINQLQWVDDLRVAIVCYINPDLEYFTVYNTKDKVFEYSLYGTSFVWDDNDIKTLVYIECPPQYANDPNATFKIHDYFGGILYESPNRIADLRYKKGTVLYNVIDKDGNKIPKSISQ